MTALGIQISLALAVITALGHQYAHAVSLRLWASTWTLVATWARDFNTDPDYVRPMALVIVLNSNPGKVVTMALWGHSH